jgi:thiamine biosynthesis lipoprotein
MIATPFNRRRFLTISAAALGFAGVPAQASKAIFWRGQALGAKASMTLTGLDEVRAQAVFLAVEQELMRLESIFSLYREGSEITRLNATGRLTAPSPELLDVLSLCAALHQASDGAFDPSIQPVWLAVATGGDVAAAQALVGWKYVRFDTNAVQLRPGMALTLNGIAQGYVTDQIAALLRRTGLGNVLIDMGEIMALGGRPDGRGWQAGIAQPDGVIVHHVALRDRALATSAPYGTVLSSEGKPGHIIDPTNASASSKQGLVSISAPRAAVADGLSTACCLLDLGKAQTAVARFAGAEIELII